MRWPKHVRQSCLHYIILSHTHCIIFMNKYFILICLFIKLITQRLFRPYICYSIAWPYVKYTPYFSAIKYIQNAVRVLILICYVRWMRLPTLSVFGVGPESGGHSLRGLKFAKCGPISGYIRPFYEGFSSKWRTKILSFPVSSSDSNSSSSTLLETTKLARSLYVKNSRWFFPYWDLEILRPIFAFSRTDKI